ncbi:hypothetical protein ACFYOT_10445 [Saccharothrix saharensis]|uniref:hypothetical protein n=1 Tax=Saccharothrix saharensis TaxID=571190 RepID=UPI0036C0401D
MNEGAPGRPSVYDEYDVEHHAKVATGKEVREQVEREYERFGPFGPYVAHLLGAGKVDDLLDAQAAQLKGQVTTRTAPPEPGVDYLGISHRELHDGVHVGGDPGRVGEHGDLWTSLGNELVEFNDAIVKAIADSEPDWTGKAGDQARRAMADLARKAGETAVAAQMAGTLFAQQSRALATARATVPPPPDEPFDVAAANRRLMTITDPIALATQAAADRAEFARQQEEHRQAARAVEVYDRTVAQTAAAQPAFAPPPAAPPRGEPAPGQPPGGVPGGRAAVPPPPAVGDATGVAAAGSEGVAAGGTTSTSGNGSSLLTPGGRDGAPGGPTGGAGPASPAAGVLGVPGSRPGTGRGGSGAGRGGVGGSGAGRSGPGGSRGSAGAGGRVPGGAGSPGSGLPGGPGTGVRGPGGGGSGVRGPGGAHGEAVGRGGRPGGAGLVAGPVGGPATGRGEEDTEHQTPSYLLEPDPEALFGGGEATAPPVIGDWSDDD